MKKKTTQKHMYNNQGKMVEMPRLDGSTRDAVKQNLQMISGGDVSYYKQMMAQLECERDDRQTLFDIAKMHSRDNDNGELAIALKHLKNYVEKDAWLFGVLQELVREAQIEKTDCEK